MISTATPSIAAAQTPANQIEATPKGTIGLGLLGAEVGFIIPALAGLDDAWAFVVFPIIGGAGGAVAGYFAIDNNNSPELAVGALALGLAMIVPTMVITLAATAYDPEDEGDLSDEDEFEEDDDGGGDEPATEEEAALERSRMVAAGAGLIRHSSTGFHLGMPGITVAASYSPEELRRYGDNGSSELRLSLFTGVF